VHAEFDQLESLVRGCGGSASRIPAAWRARRDLLLPKLLSGETEVKAAWKVVQSKC
jgi:hypothetical protein